MKKKIIIAQVIQSHIVLLLCFGQILKYVKPDVIWTI